MKPNVLGALFFVAAALGIQGAELGMDAPALDKIKTWVKGDAVSLESGRGKKVYVVEFWATWCPPCRASIPHLTELQKRFKDRGVVIVGVTDEDLDTVKPFVEKMGERMEYVVAVDNARKTSAAYMEAFEEQGIPHAFVVDQKGRVAWHGHPMAGLDKVLEDVLEGRYDIEAARRAMATEALMRDYFQLAAEDTPGAKAKDMGERILKDGGKDPALMNQFAWIMLTDPDVRHRDLELARRAAKAAYDLTEAKDASIVDTYARAQFDNGKIKEAVALQKKAVELCTDDQLRPQLEKTLKDYEAKLN